MKQPIDTIVQRRPALRTLPLFDQQFADVTEQPTTGVFDWLPISTGHVGLSNVTVTTASARGPIRIHALDRDVADGAVQWLTERAQQAGGDGT